MRNVDQMLAELRERTGLADLAFDEADHVELIFNGSLPVDVYRLDDTAVELVTPVDDPDPDASRDRLKRVLEANYLGAATGAARLALDPRTGQLTLCERVDVTLLDGPALEARLLDFAARARTWHSGRMDGLIEPEPEPGGDALAGDLTFIRG